MKLAQTLSPENSDQILFFQKNNNRTLVIHKNKTLIWLTVDDIIQSAIQHTPPYRPVLPHCYVMLLPLLYDEKPKNVLELGAGGLSLQRYINQAHPDIMMTSVENDKQIIDTVREYFPDSQNLIVIQQDAYSYIDNMSENGTKFDWLIIDLFYGADSPIHNESELFFKKVCGLISEGGWLIVNILTKDKTKLDELNRVIKKATNATVYLFAVPEMQNHIFLIKLGKHHFTFPTDVEKENLSIL